METSQLKISRTIAASPDTVFAAWTEPGEFVSWFCPTGESCALYRMDVRDGGYYLMAFGDKEHKRSLFGQYRLVRAPRRLEMSWFEGDEGAGMLHQTNLKVTCRQRKDGTELSITQAGFMSEAEGHASERAWGEALRHLERSLAPSD